ncbi:hypothetical protein AWENTII_008026 [Aspergillus wentii]
MERTFQDEMEDGWNVWESTEEWINSKRTSSPVFINNKIPSPYSCCDVTDNSIIRNQPQPAFPPRLAGWKLPRLPSSSIPARSTASVDTNATPSSDERPVSHDSPV